MAATSSTDARQEAGRIIGRFWWLPLLRGVLLVILGGYALFQPGMSLLIFTQVLGVFLVADGILAMVAAIVGGIPSRGWVALRGVLSILAGLFVFGFPMLVAGVWTTFIAYMIAVFAILLGILEIVAAIRDRKAIQGEGWLIASGTVSIIFGVLVLMAPMTFGLLIVRVLGAFAILGGISLIVLAFRIRGLGKSLTQPSRPV
jgi:uncharacterized membrane protein HdeD (DUF308 family)